VSDTPFAPADTGGGTVFAVGEEPNHHVGDKQCPEFWEEYPEPCRCGGLIHAACGTEEDSDGNTMYDTV
jgi:hypothetical protein